MMSISRTWMSGHSNSHPHEEDDAFHTAYKLLPDYFNSHPHEEDDVTEEDTENDIMNFNSHPHEEDDNTCKRFGNQEDISTHILTKRMTPCQNHAGIIVHISTHILTKRMTIHFSRVPGS